MKNIGIKIKLLVLMSVMIIFTVSITTFIISNNAKALSKQLNLQVADQTANHYAMEVKLVLEKAMAATSLLEVSFWHARLAKLNRRVLDQILIDTIHHDDNIFGTWMLWEPNAYDQQDNLFVNTHGHGETGRVNSYWHWEGKHIINEPNHDWETSTWYNNPRKRAKETLEDPYFYQVSNSKTLLISTIQPIIHDNIFYGVIGVDVKLDSLQDMVTNLKVMGVGYSTLIAHNGMYVAHPDKSLIGTMINAKAIKVIQAGEYSQTFIEDKETQEEFYQVSIPVSISDTETPWAFIVTIPMSKIISSGDSVSQLIFYISTVSGLLMLLTLLIFVEKFVAPIGEVTEQLKQAVETNNSIIPYIETSSNDEVGQLASTFNIMANDINNSRKKLQTVNDHIFELNGELEHKVKNRTLELENSLEQQKTMQGQLVESEKMASLGRLVAGMAHELNTPIGVCVTANSVLTEDIVKLNQSITDESLTKSHIQTYCSNTIETAKLIEFNLHRASELIQNFKMVSVDASSNLTYSFNLIEYINKVIQSLKPVIAKTKHRIEVIKRDEIEVVCDPGDISQILTNIVMNAITHAFDAVNQGSISIDVFKQNDSVCITCKDDGSGMSDATRNNVFEPFFTTNRDNGGSGLGMHIVYNIVVQKLKGTILCDSNSNGGTSYVIVFPIAQ